MKQFSMWSLAIVVAGLISLADVSYGGSRILVGVKIAPPPLRRELVVVRSRINAVWVAGHWRWHVQSGKYVWFPGRWITARPGFAWVDGQWKNTPHGWVYIEGNWKKI
jgi:hypothetical protein